MPDNNNIYDYGFDKSLRREITGKSTGVVYDYLNNSLNVAQLLSGGDLTLKSLSIGGLVKQVAPGDDIQAAIDAVSREGGGTVQLLADTYILHNNIEIKERVALVGSGINQTILDFEGRTAGIICKGVSSLNIKYNFILSDFTLQNSNNSGGIDIDFFDNWIIDNVDITSCDQVGLRILRSQNFKINNINSSNNTSHGVYINSPLGDSRATSNFNINNLLVNNNGGKGLYIETNSGPVKHYTINNATADSNTGNGIEVSSTSSLGFSSNDGVEGTFVSCNSFDNLGDGFVTSIKNDAISFLGCGATGNNNGFVSAAEVSILVGCRSENNTTKDYDLTDSRGVMLGCSFNSSVGIDTNDVVVVPSDFTSINNINESPNIKKRFLKCLNSTGSTIKQGSVVVYDIISGPDNVKTTTTIGDDYVLGVATSPVHFDGNSSLIQIEGPYSNILVTNGTSSISVGDWLSTYSHAYYAKKAVAGDMAFAIALEAPTTSTASINGLIISPRKI